MRKLVLAGMSAVLMGGAAFGGVICSGDSAPVALDLRAEPVVDSISVSWDASWVGGDAGATVVIEDNGVEIKRATGNGEFVHTPLCTGLHTLTYTTYIDDVAQEEVYTARVFKDWKYEVVKDGAVIVGTTQTEGNVVIPSEIDGYSVVGIGPELFAGCGSLTEVVIPGGVLDIGERAFAGCSTLRRVEVAKALKNHVELRGVFDGCPEDLDVVYIDSEIRNVVVKHRYPWGKVDVSFDVVVDMAAGLPGWNRPVLAVSATDRTTGSNYVAQASALSGDTGTEVGEHHVIWDMKAQGLDFISDDVVFAVTYVASPLYCVIDLSAGAVAASYPVSYLADVPEGGWTDAYKTTKLVLRLIEPGSFKMCGQYNVTLTQPYYIGVFEVTQRQYELVMGSNPSSYKGDMRPVEKVSWNTLRGNSSTYNWPSMTGVDPNSFVGRIQARTGLNFDFPTEAQWEYACRSGTTSSYNNGGDSETDMKQLGRYNGNKSDGKGGYSQHTIVGSYLPNKWGLYDMHGNVWEWCLDWYGSLDNEAKDPVGASSGYYRINRGGGAGAAFGSCSASYRYSPSPSTTSDDFGFRLARTVAGVLGGNEIDIRDDGVCSGYSAQVAVDLRDEPVVDSISISWDASWVCGDAGATVVIADNGTEIKRAAGNGEFTHIPLGAGLHEFTYTTYIDDVAQDEVYTAKVIKVEYEVTFDAAGGTVGTASKAVTYDVEYGELPTASCERYVFLGWTLDGVDVTAETIVKTAENHTLTAKWGIQIGGGIWAATICDEAITLDESLVPPSGEVVIPATIAGRPVVGITAAAFAGNEAVTRLTIPASVTNIEAGALGAIPATIIINDDTQTIQDAVKANVRKVVFAEGATRINDNFFDGCLDLETFDIAESVIGIGTNVFEAASALETESSNGFKLYQGWCLGFADEGVAMKAITIPEGVRGIAAGAFEYEWEEYEWEIETVEFPSTLRFVGARAFKDCTGIEDVTLPNGVVAVGREAFRNCTYVQELSLPTTLKEIDDGAFANCTMLTALTIPEGVVDIGEEAFSNCWRVTSVAIPASVANVGAGAFANCKRIANATVPLGLATMAELFPASYNKITSVAVVSGGQPVQMVPGMFRGCTALKSLPLPDLLCEIPEEAFVGCESMASFSLPDTVTNIGARAFKDLAQLEAFAFPTGLVAIGEEAFYGLSQLARVDIPTSIKQIGESAFGGCVGIRAVSLLGDLAPVATIWPDAYDKITSATVIRGNLTASLFEGCAALTHVEMPEGVASIGMRAFAGCASLAAADVPSSVTNLGAEVFKDCASLESVSLSRRLTALPDGAFAGCSALEEVIVPESVTSVGNGVFSGCAQLQAVRFVGNAPVCTAAGYDGAPASLITYAAKGSRGWDGIPTSKALPEFWPDGTEHEIWPWTPSRFTVVFDKNDGTSSAIEVGQVVGTTFLLPEDATRTGAEFCGWWTTSDGGSRLTESVRVASAESYTAYAHWAFNTYSVRFDANGGDGEMEDQLMTVATRTNLLECAYSRLAYTFVGWAVEPEGAVVYADAEEVVDLAYGQDDVVTLYAKWTANGYEVTFDVAGGAVETASKAVTYDAEYGELPSATRMGYTFIGWKFDDEVITSNTIVKTATDHVLVAQWTANQYVVTFNANGGSVSQTSIDVTYGTAYGELPSATRAGHTFAGWWTAADGGVQVTADSVANVATDHCLYAHWVEIRHDVTFDANGGSLGAESAVRSVLEGSAIGELPTQTRARYAFAGWWTAANGGAQVSASTVVEENVTYYAHWVELEVSYNIVNGVLWSVNLNGATEANIPNGVTSIGSEAFCELVELTKVVMPDSVTSIGECAFFGCENLSEVVWSRNLDIIGDEAFVYAGLTAVNLSNTVVRIVGEQAFAGCYKLQSVVFPNTLTTLGSHVFAVCDELTSVTFYGNAPTIDNSAEETSENFPNGDIYVSWTPAGEEDDDFDIYLDKVTTYVTMRSSGWGVVPGTWQSRPILYLQDEGNVHTAGVDVGEKGTVEEIGGAYVVEAKEDETLTEADFSFGVAKEAYVVNIAAGGKTATVVLKSPEVRRVRDNAPYQAGGSGAAGGEIEEGVSEDAEDSAGILASVEDIVAKHGESAIKAKPTPKSGETVGALPVKTYEGLYYQAAWGDDLGTMTQGEKVQATGDTLYLGVIKQKGNKGFYKITVSEQ